MNTIDNTPAHCHNCHQFAYCHQAQNMVANTEPEEGFFSDGDIYCADCLKGFSESYIGESDSPQHCVDCGVPIIHDLTPDGIEYVRNNLVGCCQELWPIIWDIQPKIPVDSIVIPKRFVELCEGWTGSEVCMLRAVSSTGNLTTGTHSPRGCETEEQWYLTIWRNLSSDIGCNIRLAINNDCTDPADIDDLVEFEDWVDEQVERLEESYGLVDWDAYDGWYVIY